jgi:phospholipid/cholesterol/gamma-HCH transport system permease protein
MQILFTGVEALAVVAVLGLAFGVVIIIQGLSLLPRFGQGQLIYTILIATITRELGPILTAFIIIARSGTAIATELGTMVVNHEVEGYVASGINPIGYLAVPRVAGVTISTLVLTLYFNIFGLIGSFFVTQVFRPIRFAEYFGGLLSSLQVVDLASSAVKSLVFGLIIGTVATYYGFRVQRSSTEVPKAAISAVTRSFVYCILANGALTLLYYV